MTKIPSIALSVRQPWEIALIASETHTEIPQAGIIGPLSERLIFAAMCETFRTARRAGKDPIEAQREAEATGLRAMHLAASTCLAGASS